MFLLVKRYLFAKKSHSVVNIITTLSLVALSLPVAAVIILLSVFNGFGELILQTNRVVDPDVTIRRSHGNLFDVEAIPHHKLTDIEGVEALSFVSEQSVLLEHDGRQVVATLRGVDSSFLSVVPLDKNVVKGSYIVQLGELDRLVIGNALAYRLGARNLVDSFIDVYSLKGSGFSSLLPMSNYTKRSFKQMGHFSADLQSEERYAITSLRGMQKLTNSIGKASQVMISLSKDADQQRTMEAIRQVVGDEFEVKSRYELNPMMYDIVSYEKWGLLFISMLIMLLASFSLIGALSMLIIEKRGDILTLRAMGGSWNFIRRIFFGEGLLISLFGVALGVVVGSSVTLLQQTFGLVKIPSQTFLSNHYPVVLLFSDVVIVVVASLAISTLLSLVVVRHMIKRES
ncbi:MAG: FtsX-like permease family protein [Rikenellaceae bacterium]